MSMGRIGRVSGIALLLSAAGCWVVGPCGTGSLLPGGASFRPRAEHHSPPKVQPICRYVPCQWMGEPRDYTDEGRAAARADAREHERAAHAGRHTVDMVGP